MSDAYNAGRQYDAPEEESQLVNLWRVVRERWWIVAASTAICAGTTLAVALSTEDTYEASARLLFRDPGLSAAVSGASLFEASSDPQRDAATNVELVRSTQVAELALESLFLVRTPQDLLDSLTISAEENTDIVNIAASEQDPAIAAAIANAFAEAYVTFRRQTDREKVIEGEQLVRDRIRGLAQGSPERASLENSLQTLISLEAVQTGNAEVVDVATAPSDASSPKPARDAVLGLLFGLAFGISLALLLDLVDRRVKTVESFERRYGLRALTTVPQRFFNSKQNDDIVAEPYRILRSAVDYRSSWKPIRVVLITSASPGEGKTSVAVNLARSVAMGGQRVVLVEADMRRPSIGKHIDLGPVGPGLGAALAMDTPVGKLVTETAISTLRILPSGPPPPNPSELVRRRRMVEILEELAAGSDLVIIDSPPLLPVADAQTLLSMPQIDACIVVARAFQTTKQQVSRTRAILHRHAVEPLGLVVCGTKDRLDYYSGYQPPVSGRGQPRPGMSEKAPAGR